MSSVIEVNALALRSIVALLSAKQRQSVASEIKLLADNYGVKDDLISDRRKSMWKQGGPARATVEKRPERLAVQIVYRGSDGYDATYTDAAKLLKLTVGSLRVRLSHGKGKYHTMVEDDVVTIVRL